MSAGETGGSRRLALAVVIAGLLFAALVIVSPSRATAPRVPPTDSTVGVTDRTTVTDFEPPTTYQLTVTIRGGGSVSDAVDCTQATTKNSDSKTCEPVTVFDGTTAVLIGAPRVGFTGPTFSGACTGSTCSIPIDGDKHVTATFVDRTPPAAPTITAPAAGAVLRSDGSPALSFRTGTGTARTSCAVDGASLTSCSSPWRLPAIADGTHTLHLRALDVNGNFVDVTRQIGYVNVPNTSIGGTPGQDSATNSRSTSFSYSGGASFLCKLDGETRACLGDYSQFLADGSHTLAVRAGASLDGSTYYYDETPAERTWTIDTAAPVTTIASGPPAVTSDRSAAFAFSAPSLTAVSYECSLDGGAFAACASGVRYDNLALGGHSFAVRGHDAAGNRGAARTRSWTVVPPTVTPTPTPVASSTPQPGGGGSGGAAGGSGGTRGSSTTLHGARRMVRGDFSWRYRYKHGRTWFTRLRLRHVTKGAKVRVRCRGRGCPHHRRHLTLHKLLHRKLRKGAVIQVRITERGMTGAVVYLKVRKAGRDPVMRTKCLKPGSRKPTSC